MIATLHIHCIKYLSQWMLCSNNIVKFIKLMRLAPNKLKEFCSLRVVILNSVSFSGCMTHPYHLAFCWRWWTSSNSRQRFVGNYFTSLQWRQWLNAPWEVGSLGNRKRSTGIVVISRILTSFIAPVMWLPQASSQGAMIKKKWNILVLLLLICNDKGKLALSWFSAGPCVS